MDYEIKFNNKEVFEFYTSHNLDAEFVNVSFINILKKLMNNLDLQIIIPAKRTDFETDYDVAHTTPPHKTIWICWKMNIADGRQIIFE